MALRNKVFENEKLFAEKNSRMAEATSGLAPNNFPRDFIMSLYCECANKVCYDRIDITYDDYHSVRSNHYFVIRPNHILPEFERLMGKTAEYWLIMKRPEKLDKRFEV